MEKENLVRPSLLSADFTNLSSGIEEAIALGITHMHYDVMDGQYVHDISYGEPVFASLMKKYGSQMVFDVHLMTLTPLLRVASFASLGASEICFQYETMTLGDLPRMEEIRAQYPNLKIGLAIHPDTKIEDAVNVFSLFDYILVMSVVPGKGGQKFIPESLARIRALDQFRNSFSLAYQIGVDGGINDVTGPNCVRAGADFLVAGSYYFKSDRKAECLSRLHGSK